VRLDVPGLTSIKSPNVGNAPTLAATRKLHNNLNFIMVRILGTKIRAFNEIKSGPLFEQFKRELKSEIEMKNKQYILGVDEQEFKTYLINKYTLELLEIDNNSEIIGEPTLKKEWREFNHGRYEAEYYSCTVTYIFSGSPILFKLHANSWTLTSHDIYVNEKDNTVSFQFELTKRDAEEYKKGKADFYKKSFTNLDNANRDATSWNNEVASLVNSNFNAQKNKFQEENDFFAAINVKVNPNTSSVFTAPTVQKKIIPQPTVSKSKEFSPEPTMSKEMYNDILTVIYDSGKNMEKKPSLYQGKDEESLRDQFLFVLETRYEGTTATGETFNRGGKTDIILKYAKDASNLFVAECKFWHGGSEFLKAISQLFDRYLTWRDSKAALLLFVTNKDFSNVIETFKAEAKNHPYFIKESGNRGETSFSYIYHLPQDENKHVQFEIMAFHYDK
jgi:hypothetical protein